MDIQNPEKIEIEGLQTIHKLCKFGADHNMEGCSFTEIVERMFDELSKTQAIPEGFVLVPKEPTKGMIAHITNTPIEVNLLCDHADVFLSEEEVYIAYKAMIEAQEQGHD
ncbi:hypothetical protein [Acinetobacter sp. CFCC 10889]|uniref:hypothetical protein n=1 Tax=Acinetobacter sp. CFCC 10889 TaxID=1775557 RepID=UPI000DD0C206|nr:hypothetical protein [Acinetobacter sp. CFCC 10889]